MSDYGVTTNGFVKKRLDVIVKEIQSDLTEEFGFDVSLNPESFLNVLITTYADRIAQLWECAEQVYFSHYPSSAEGINLDNVAQFGGIVREGDKRTVYTVVCTGDDGTDIPAGTRIASDTSPKVYFAMANDGAISRSAFCKAIVKVVTPAANTAYTITLNGAAYTVTSGTTATETSILTALKSAITDTEFVVTLNDAKDLLTIECSNGKKNNELALSENLTTTSVSSLLMFQSEEYGKIDLPRDSITEIVTTIVGFESCYNLSSPTYGRLRETDAEFRQSYLKKIVARSSMMLETITEAILENVSNVKSASAYQNDTGSDELREAAVDCIEAIRSSLSEASGTDAISAAIAQYDSKKAQAANSLPAHTIEVVVDGGDEIDIAKQIFANKAAGIGTYGDVSVEIPDSFGNNVTVKFSRPQNVYVWLKATVQPSPTQPMPSNAEDIIKTIISDSAEGMKAGSPVLTQDYIVGVRNECPGISYIDITAYHNTSSESEPSDDDYTERCIYPTQRQKAIISKERIEVVINDN